MAQKIFRPPSSENKGSSEISVGNRKGKIEKEMRKKGNFRNMRMYIEGDKDGRIKYGRKKEKITINMKLKLDFM
jgi:hypothetical protein